MIDRERARLRRLFRSLVLASLAAPAASTYACGSSNETPSPDAGVDATSGTDGSGGEDAVARDTGTTDGALGDGAADLDAYVNCTPGHIYQSEAGYQITYIDATAIDAGPDAEADGAPIVRYCYNFRDYPCGPVLNHPTAECVLHYLDCTNICKENDAGSFFDCRFVEGAGCTDGSLTWEAGEPGTIACGLCVGVGRRPRGLAQARRAKAEDVVGDYLADAAHLEAASVFAFEALGRELAAHRAPRALVRSAARSAGDERRHARVTTDLARRRGARPQEARVRRRAPRSLAAIARENAVEGCVRETFGALVATWQAAHAKDEALRAAMERIAIDETRHAALAWAVARWAEPRLTAAERRRIGRARCKAVRDLEREVSRGTSAQLVREAGLPDAATARALVRRLEQSLWA